MSTSPRERIEDFGEKIGGARKDKYKGTIVAADVASMDSDQREKFCTKASAWPTPDYSALFAAGHTRIALAHIKAIRDAFPAAPWQADTEHITAYVDALAALRALGKCRTLGDIHAILYSAEFRPFYELEKRATGLSARTGETLRKLFTSNPAGYRATQKFFNAITDCAFQDPNSTNATYSLKWLRKNPEWPLGEELWEKFARRRGWEVISAADAKWRVRIGYYTSDNTPLEKERFTDESAARAALQKHVEAILDERRAKKKSAREELEARAAGTAVVLNDSAVEHDWTNGRDIEGEDFLKEFGFRGGEFGNWVNQSERRDLLNRGYNALRDLAFVLDVPPAALSHNSRLGIAFGARGHGGARPAAAHYEPSSRAINLTKPHGEGSLCHELLHAFDHALYRLLESAAPRGAIREVSDLSSSDFRSFLSAHLVSRSAAETVPSIEGFPMAVFVEMSTAMDAIAVVRETPDQATDRLRKALDDAKGYLSSWLRYAPQLFQRASDSPEALKNFTAFLAEKSAPLLEPECSDGTMMSFVQNLQQAIGRTRGVADLLNAVEHGTFQVRRAHKALADAAKEGIPPHALREIASPYKRACLALDEKRSSPYFSQRCEMAARAFETYVADKLAQHGRASPYLVKPVGGEAYPQGAERVRVINALDPAIKTWAAAMREIHAERIVIATDPADSLLTNSAPLPTPQPVAAGRAASI